MNIGVHISRLISGILFLDSKEKPYDSIMVTFQVHRRVMNMNTGARSPKPSNLKLRV